MFSDLLARWKKAQAITLTEQAQRAKLRDVALYVFICELGRGEYKHNNVGPDLVRYAEGLPWKPGDPWCGLPIAYAYREASIRTGIKVPFVLSPGAGKLADRMGAVGRRYKDPLLALPGDVVCWWRNPLKPWEKHVEMVERQEDGIIHTIAGNVGSAPAKVRRLIHDVSKERLYTFAGI